MTNELARGLMWRRQIARIAERRAARNKSRPQRSIPSGSAGPQTVGPVIGTGSPGVISDSEIERWTPSPGQYYVRTTVGETMFADWPPSSGEFETSAGAPAPIAALNRPPI